MDPKQEVYQKAYVFYHRIVKTTEQEMSHEDGG